MPMCELCARLPERQDSLPPDPQTAHLEQEKRLGQSSPHFPKKYVRECSQCGTKRPDMNDDYLLHILDCFKSPNGLPKPPAFPAKHK